jgi:hypothetical protein
MYALLATQTDKIFFAKVPITGAEFLPIFLVGTVILYWWVFYRSKARPLWWWWLALMIMFFSVVHFHPQWWVWAMPVVVIYLAKEWPRSIYPVLVWLGCYLMFILSFEPSLNFSLFERLHPGWHGFNFTHWLVKYYEPPVFFSMFRAVFAGTGLWVIGQRIETDGKRIKTDKEG